MKVVIKEKNSVRINKFLDSILYILGYTIVLLIVDAIFNSLKISNTYVSTKLDKKETEELNEIAGFDKPISSCDWPEYDASKTIDDEIEIPVQVNGKLKTTITINLGEDESSIKEKVHLALEGKLDGKSIVKEIYVKNKIFNVDVK